ncbi:MAG: glycosyltransferase [Candidatus Omnitrophica bacterium]|nr:glycosyltransferase [Candidatus Omnitrophota bacterium]
MKKVSLYIPCFNVENYIGQCLESVLNQSYQIDEIMVIDDGSTDKTVDIVSHYNVKIIRHQHNKGIAATRNTAFKIAKNDFVAALDADCSASKHWLETLMNSFTDRTIAGVGGALLEKGTASHADRWRAVHMIQNWGTNIVHDPPFLFGSNTLFIKSFVLRAGAYNTFFKINSEDIDLSSRMKAQGYNLLYNPNAAVNHLRNDTTTSVLLSFWHWNRLRYINLNSMHSITRYIATYIGKSSYFINTIIHPLQHDIKNKYYSLLFIDILLIFYYPLLNICCFILFILRSTAWKKKSL